MNRQSTPRIAAVAVSLFTTTFLLCGQVPSARSAFDAAELRCDNQVNPLAVASFPPELSWKLESPESSARGLVQSAYQILVASSQRNLAAGTGDLWDSGRVSSSETRTLYAGRRPPSAATCWWKVRVWDGTGNASAWSAPSHWSMGLQAGDWRAKWIARQPDGEEPEPAMPVFRRTFQIGKSVERALLYISGMGHYEARLNGTKLEEAVLAPGWTNYRKTVFYNTFDVTSLLRMGENALGIMLGNGMYHVVKTPGRYTKFTGSFGQPKLIAQLQIAFSDGSTVEIVTDKNWKTLSGPIVYSSTFGGEDFDARLEPVGWDRAGFDDRRWAEAREVNGPGGVLVSQTNPDIKVLEVFHPVRTTEPKPGVLVYDLGQNFSGWPGIKVRGPAGATLRLFPGELLDENGLVSQRSSGGSERAGYQWYSYTLNGAGDESWQPRFAYYGFRYVQVEGAATTQAPSPDKPRMLALDGEFLHSSARPVGEFSCSNPLFNDIHRLITAAVRSNMQSVLTDCPHREKLGWLEETHLLGSAIMYNYDVLRLYRKISADMRDSQTPEGLVPDIAPEYVVFEGGFRDSPEWGSAVVFNPWLAYRHYGDRRILGEHYGEMKRYVEYLTSRAKDGIVSHGLGDWYDIGPKPPGVAQLTSTDLTATSVYYAAIMTLGRIAALLEKDADARVWMTLGAEVRRAFTAKLYDPNSGIYDRGSQTAFAMPLVVGLVAEEDRKSVLDKLVEAVRKNGNGVTAGDIGFHFVVQALAEGGRSDVLFDMLARTDGPSYGFQLKQGATTLTEAWDAGPASSQNHFMLGHAEEWFYRYLAGLDLDFSRPATEQIQIRPNVVGDITEATATHDSILGRIVSHWKTQTGQIQLAVTVPPNASATVHVPTSDPDSVAEGGVAAAHSKGVRPISRGSGAAIFNVESGSYVFTARK